MNLVYTKQRTASGITKSRGHARLDRRINSWQGRQFRNQTFEDDVEVNVEELRELLDMGGDCDEALYI
jgi:hypothetical protein